MRPLFVKVLALVLSSFFLVLVVAFGLFWWVNLELNPEGTHLHKRTLVVAEELVEAALENDHHPAMDRLHRRGVRAWILDQTNQPIVGPPIPPEILVQTTRFPMVIRPYQNTAGRNFIITHEIRRDRGSYRVILSAARKDLLRGRHGGFFWFPIIAVLLGLVLASVLLSHWVLRPLRTFRQTASAISGDSLEARIPPEITQRRDAFGELGREFNRMTQRVEDSLDNQKQLLRDVSHELRSPLSRILMAASLNNKKHGRSAEIDRIETEVDRLDSLIEDLLSLSRLQSVSGIVTSSVNLNQVLQQVREDAEFEFQSSNKKTITHLEPNLLIKGDSDLLTSAFENVVRNACRFSPDNDTVEISAVTAEGVVTVSVIDHGPGVSDQLLSRIFDPFFKADQARSEDDGQHGIGLALSKAIIELHGGNISAQNHSPHGLVIKIRLPL
jgi:signal transduction histidine kinase